MNFRRSRVFPLPARGLFAGLLIGAGVALVVGCGSIAQPDFPACIRNASGDCILLDDIEPIVNDSTLTDDEKRARLRDLGLEDEQLINALINS